MIYLFGSGDNVSIIYKGETLTELQKSRASLVLPNLPPTETPEGFIARAYLSPTKVFSWKYVEMEIEKE